MCHQLVTCARTDEGASMKYKVYKESPLPDVDWQKLRKRIEKPITSYQHRHDPLYYDDEDIWFWHRETRKRVAFVDIDKVEKATLHGFGKMVRLTYLRGKGPAENGKPAQFHLIDVASLNRSPAEIAADLRERVTEAHTRVIKAQPKRRFNADD
ncbi:MAG: hypothetical protein AAFR20_04870 [Pseudomonadota bacterium]